MASFMHDALFELTKARWDCVNSSGPCDCDNGVNAARVAQQQWWQAHPVEQKAELDPILNRRGPITPDPAPTVSRPMTRWEHLMKAIFG